MEMLKRGGLILLLAAGFLVPAGFWLWTTAHQPLGNLLTAGGPTLLVALGRLAGLIAAAGLLVQLVLIARVGWAEPVFGLDRLTRVHHLNAALIVVCAIAHPLLLAAGDAPQFGSTFGAQLLDFVKSYEDVPGAAAGLLLLIAVAVLSLARIRRRMHYERWHGLHLLGYAALVLAAGHQFSVGTDFATNKAFLVAWWALYAFAALNLLGYRFLQPALRFARQRFTVDRLERETPDVMSVYLRGRRLGRLRAKPGQFMILRFLQKGFRWEAHPFSLSCAPNPDSLRVSIKSSGDFTARIPELKPGTRVIVDGPHGAFTPTRDTREKILMIAGGIGITPLRSMAEPLAAAGKDIVLIYGNRRRQDIAFAKELDGIARTGRLKIHHVLSHDPGAPGEVGHVDLDRIRRLVPDARERDVFLCGPPPMMDSVVGALLALGIPKRHIHSERFSL